MIQSIMLVYNMVDSAFKRKLSKKLYGSSIKKSCKSYQIQWWRFKGTK